MHHRKVHTGLGFAIALGSLGACFSGSGAEGLPCSNDDDCGLSLSCNEQTGCCGDAACLVITDAGSETTTSTTTTTDATSTTTTDTTTTGSTTTLTTSSSTTDETDTGPVTVCGNEDVEEGEACDEGSDNEAPIPPCDARCQDAVFHWQGDPFDGWDASADNVQMSLFPTDEADPWAPIGNMAWGSGLEPAQPSPLGDYWYGEKVLLSPSITIPTPPAGLTVSLAIRHRLRFDQCMEVPMHRDGGRVYLYRGPVADERVQVMPEPLSPLANTEVLADDSICVTESATLPWAADGNEAFVGRSGMMGDPPLVSAVRIPANLGVFDTPIRLGFVAGYDCIDCDLGDPPANHWVIEAVTIKYLEAP